MSAMGREITADEGRPWVIGRDKAADLHLEDASVSRRHAIVRFDPSSGWLLEDANSRNGTFRDGERISQLAISGPVTVTLGGPDDGCVVTLAPTAPRSTARRRPGGAVSERAVSGVSIGHLASVYEPPTTTVRIGRARDNDLVVDDVLASRHHAELRRRPDGSLELVDLGSHNGTYLDGVPVAGPSI